MSSAEYRPLQDVASQRDSDELKETVINVRERTTPKQDPPLPFLKPLPHKAGEILNFRRLLAQAKPEKHLIIGGTVALFFSAIFTLSLPAFAGVIIDAISNSDGNRSYPTQLLVRITEWLGFSDTPRSLLGVACVLLTILVILGSLLSFLRGYLFSITGERVVSRLRNTLFQRIIMQDISFFDTTRTGELINRLSTDTTILGDAVTVNVSMGLRWTTTVIAGIGYLFFISWKLTLVMLSVVPLVAIFARVYGAKIRDLSKSTQDALARATEVSDETISLIRTVRSFHREPYQEHLYATRIQDTYVLGAKKAFYMTLFIAAITTIGSGAMILVLWYGATLVLDGELTSGVLTSFVLYTITVGAALAGVAGLFTEMMKALGANQRVFSLIDSEPSIKLEGGSVLPALRGEVELEHVHFAYPSRTDVAVLTDVSLRLRPGTVTALVGPSGGGKSTIVGLIERFYDVSSGRILIDGVDLRELDAAWLHRKFALISQEPVLFCTTIRDNLTYGMLRDVSDDEINTACRRANAYDFINDFPDKYETMVGERGVRLSGGQKQRVAIARAILMDPIVLIADEATSSLDAESEFKVQEALDRLMQHRTVLVVAHRLSTVVNADNVVVISQGKKVEEGSHSELLKRSGIYANLVRRQLSQAGSPLAAAPVDPLPSAAATFASSVSPAAAAASPVSDTESSVSADATGVSVPDASSELAPESVSAALVAQGSVQHTAGRL